MAKPNYRFQKHQRELAKKKKREAKLQNKLAKSEIQPAETSSEIPVEKETGDKQ